MKQHVFPLGALIALAIALPLCLPLARAQDLPPPADPAPFDSGAFLSEYVVTASREEELPLEAPYTVEVLTESLLKERAVRTVPEAFEQTPGVLVQKTAHGQGSPFIRGWTAYHNLFLIDGIRLNNAAFRSGPNQYWNTVDSQGLRALELVKSQGSVLFGSDAVGGTVQAFTHRPHYAEGGSLVSGRSYSRYASAENSFIQRGEVSLSEAGQYGLILGGSWKDFGDIEAADLGTLPFTGYEEWDVDGKLEIVLNSDTRLTFFHQQVHLDDAWRVHKTAFAKSFAGSAIGDERARILDQNRLLSYVQLDGNSSSPFFEHYVLSFSHQRHGEQQFRQRADGRADVQGFDLDSYGAWAQFQKPIGTTELLYGLEYYQDRIDSFRDDFNADGSFRQSRIQGPVGDDGVYHLASGYFNTSSPIGDRLTLDLGGRYTYA
ncbi:MAG: TonB-dependent receptor plug domain-containing protein, partial [Verrucomicrobiota bacterium]